MSKANGRLAAQPARPQEPARPAAIADLITVEVAAKWLGVSRDTIRGWVCRGVLAAYNIGSQKCPRYRIPVKSVLEKFQRVEPLRLQ